MSEGLRTVTVSGSSPLVRVTAHGGVWRFPSQVQLWLEKPNQGKNLVLSHCSVFLLHLSVSKYLVTLDTNITVSNVSVLH